VPGRGPTSSRSVPEPSKVFFYLWETSYLGFKPRAKTLLEFNSVEIRKPESRRIYAHPRTATFETAKRIVNLGKPESSTSPRQAICLWIGRWTKFLLAAREK
jgi:hypothetical protein